MESEGCGLGFANRFKLDHHQVHIPAREIRDGSCSIVDRSTGIVIGVRQHQGECGRLAGQANDPELGRVKVQAGLSSIQELAAALQLDRDREVSPRFTLTKDGSTTINTSAWGSACPVISPFGMDVMMIGPACP